jgi:N-acetylmuramoyl-L-alanine amidase
MPAAVLRGIGVLALAGIVEASHPSQAADPKRAEPDRSPGSSIIVAGQTFEVGRPVVLWSDPQGFDGYQTRCIDQSGGCCDFENKRYGVRGGLRTKRLEELQGIVSQFILHFDGCVNSRSCFKSMHNRPRPRGESGCGLSAHFMIDADGTIYQTLDLIERAYHAEEANTASIGVEICNRGRVDRGEWSKLPADYRTRPTRDVVVNGEHHLAYEFRPEQYDSIIALTRVLLRIFPRIRPIVPEEPDGRVILDTLADPMSFAGILGHLHVDLQKQKWDPGPLDFHRILRALNGFAFPVQVRSFTEVPRTEADLLAARRALFYNAEERATGYFPLESGRLWHSGVHLRSARGSIVRAPTRGRIVAARRATAAGSSRSFVLIRHELDLDGTTITFYSLLVHLDLTDTVTDGESIPWLRSIGRGSAAQRVALDAGEVVLLDERVEAGDPVGRVGIVSRGPEQGPEVHFEIFTTERLGGEIGRAFRYVNAAGDGPLVRRADLVAAADANNDAQVDAAELKRFFRTGDLDRRQSFRRLVVRHRHEWGDRATADELVTIRELAGISESDRRRLHAIAIAPYVFWTAAGARATGLPVNQIIYSYNPLTFLLELASQAAHIDLHTARGREIGQSSLQPRKLVYVPVTDWTSPTMSPIPPPLFSPPVGMRLGPTPRSEIPLIELAPTDGQ